MIPGVHPALCTTSQYCLSATLMSLFPFLFHLFIASPCLIHVWLLFLPCPCVMKAKLLVKVIPFFIGLVPWLSWICSLMPCHWGSKGDIRAREADMFFFGTGWVGFFFFCFFVWALLCSVCRNFWMYLVSFVSFLALWTTYLRAAAPAADPGRIGKEAKQIGIKTLRCFAPWGFRPFSYVYCCEIYLIGLNFHL
jgi:hypothetical protein